MRFASIFSYVLMVFLSLVTIPGTSIAARTISDIDELLEVSGIIRQLSGFPEVLKLGLSSTQAGQEKIDSTVVALMNKAVDEAIQPLIIKNNIRNLLVKELSSAELKKLMDWYRSPAGKKIIQAEEYVLTSEGYLQMSQSLPNFKNEVGRLNLMAEIDEAIEATESSYELQVGVQLGVVEVVNKMINPASSLNMEAMRDQMQSQELIMKQALHKNLLLTLAFTYRNLSDEDVKAYIKFLNTPSAQKFTGLATRELNANLLRGMSLLGGMVAREIKQYRSQENIVPSSP